MPHWFSLGYRIGVGMAFFAAMAVIDLARKGRAATRWREYLFLLTCTAGAIAYGVINDQITWRISWEYFFYGKELYKILGGRTPPDSVAMAWQAARIGTLASWSAGLVAGAALLFVNSQRQRRRAPLNYGQLLKLVGGIALLCAGMGAILGVAGYFGGLNWMDGDFAEMYRFGYWRPRHFTAVYGIHLGGYVGVAIGTIVAVWRVWTTRQRA